MSEPRDEAAGRASQTMRDLCLDAVAVMEGAFRVLERQVPPPKIVRFHDGFVFRYVERMPEQAILQKLARCISGLHAIDILLLNGFVQEQGALQRTLDEFGDDIMFLALGITTGRMTDLHERFLADFWEEEFDGPTPMESSQKRGMVKRKSIRAYLSRQEGMDDPSTFDKLQRTLHRTYSGYVHAASPHIMEMVGGTPPLFHLAGLSGTPRIAEHASDALNYFYRGVVNVAVAAKAFGNGPLVEALYVFLRRWEKVSGGGFTGGAFQGKPTPGGPDTR